MQESVFYLLKNEYAEKVAALGGKYQDTKERPIYCCVQDTQIEGLYWAIPTSDINHRTPAQIEKLKCTVGCPQKIFDHAIII